MGTSCFIIDACKTGLGITFISDTKWPEEIELKYTLPRETEGERRVAFRTAWESSMDYYKTGSTETVRRRGLEFIDPASENADILFQHLSALGTRDN